MDYVNTITYYFGFVMGALVTLIILWLCGILSKLNDLRKQYEDSLNPQELKKYTKYRQKVREI